MTDNEIFQQLKKKVNASDEELRTLIRKGHIVADCIGKTPDARQATAIISYCKKAINRKQNLAKIKKLGGKLKKSNLPDVYVRYSDDDTQIETR